jgi:hypothetical protein
VITLYLGQEIQVLVTKWKEIILKNIKKKKIQRAGNDDYYTHEDDFLSGAEGEWLNSSEWVIAITRE